MSGRQDRAGARLFRTALLLAAFACVLEGASAQEPLHERIDRGMADIHVGPVTPPATDAEFLRRIYLDLTGSIPPTAEVRKFLDDPSPDKRTAILDRLLDGPAYTRHMAATFDLMLMERRGDKYVKSDEWQKYLLASFEANKPYNQLAAEILAADGVDPKQRAPAKFYLDRDAEPNLLTRELGRMFFGMDLECAQCHDHPLIDDYLQSDYYGLYAFVSRSYIFRPDPKKPAVLAEKAEGDVNFKSVFTGEEGKTRPRLPGGREIDEPTFNKGEEYQVKPDPKNKAVRPVPKYSRREQLARLATSGENRAFNRNIANRLWAHMMGRGLVHPVDLHYATNPPAHPELLEALADAFVAMNFDVKAFLRELALSQTYQRSFRMPANLGEHIAAAGKQLPADEDEQERIAALVAQLKQEVKSVRAERDQANGNVAAITAELAKANSALAAAKQAAGEAQAALSDAKEQLAAKQDLAKTLAEAAAKTAEAVKKLPEDKELLQAAQTFQARSRQVADEVTALTLAAADRSAAQKTTAGALAEANKSADLVAAKFDAAKQQAAALDARLAEADGKLASAGSERDAVTRRLQEARLLADYGEKLAAADASGAAVLRASTDLPAAREAATKAEAESAKLQTELAAAQTAHSDAAQILADASRQLAEQQEVTKLIGESLAKAELAAKKLPTDTELAEAVQKLKSRSDQLTKQADKLQKVAATRQAEEKAAAEQLAVAVKAAQNAATEVTDLKQKAEALQAQLTQATAKAEADRSAADSSYEKLAEYWNAHFDVAVLEQLSPEQMAWSIMQATGLADRQRAASAAEIEKKTPLTPEEQKDPAKLAQRDAQIEQAVYDKLKGNVGNFVKLFAAGAGQPQHEFFATVDQALFFSNGNEVRSWLAPGGGNLTDRLIKTEDPQDLAEELYLSVLTRRPTETEAADVADYLASAIEPDSQSPAPGKNTAVQELVWALLTSTEFRFHH